MDVSPNKVANKISTNKLSIPLANSSNAANKIQMPKSTRDNLEYRYTNNQETTNNKIKHDKLRLYHQNIRGISKKTEELTTQWATQFPYLLCFTEHHLRDSELTHISIEHYTLGVSYCRQSRTHGGVGIFVRNTLSYSTINRNQFCNDHDLEACAIQLIILPNIYNILCIYRPPSR